MRRPSRLSFLTAFVVCLSVSVIADAPEVRALRNAKFTRIEVPGGRITEASGLNNVGDIVGSWIEAVTERGRGFVFSGGMYTSIDIPGALFTSVADINDAGDIVGSYTEPGGPGQLFGDTHGFLLTADGQLTTITFPGQRVTEASGINKWGQIVGNYVEVESDQVLGVHGFMFENDVFTPIDFPVPMPRAHIFVTFATGINDTGEIVGGYNADDIFETRHGFVLRDGVYSTFDVPGSGFTDLFGINNAGEIVGETSISDGIQGFLFSPKRGFFRLPTDKGKQEFSDFLLPFDINDLNQFVGDGVTVDGLRGFVARLPPGW